VSELTGVAFDGAETGVGDYAVGKSGLAHAWWAVEKYGGRRTGGGGVDPVEESRIVVTM